MNNFIKKNINSLIAIFILLQPILDLATGLCLHLFKVNFTLGIVIRIIFLLFICIITLFTFKKKKLLVPYFIIGLYFIFYLIGLLLYKDSNLFQELQGLIRVFYFPILLISLYSIKDEIRISKLTLFTTLFIYLILIFVPLLLKTGYKTYEITKAGTLGFFNSANEISGIISILTPFMFLVFLSSKKIVPIIISFLIYLVVILMIGTKTPFLSLGITSAISIIYLGIKLIKKKEYNKLIISLAIILIASISLIIIIPRTNFYKNIKTHLDYLELDSIREVFTDEELIDHFIFSQRLTFLRNKKAIYNKAPIYQKIFGIGYINNNKTTKLIEMDYFDIYYSHGVVGFLLFAIITLFVVYNILKNRKTKSYEAWMISTSLLLIVFLSFFTGHIITAPSVSLISIIVILSIEQRKKKDLLFADRSLEIGGIEVAQVNLLNNLDYNKYNVTLILEKKKGSLLKKLNKNVRVKELKVSNNKIIILRKLINLTRKLIFKVFNYQNYDFSCCYTTYSFSCNKIAKIASQNNAFYVHSDYSNLYKEEKEFRTFFDSRKVDEYKHIIFVSNESRNSYLKYYENLKDKTIVLNNLVNIKEIKEKSNEKVLLPQPKAKKVFVFVGRLDDSSKKLKRAISLVKELNGIELWIVGDGPDKETYSSFVNQLQLNDRVTFFGSKENPYPYMKAADYLILTSDYEGFPVIYLEAITLNKKIITTIKTSDDSLDISDYAYIVSKDPETMVEEVKEILKQDKQKAIINLEEIQRKRIMKLEKIINNEI